MGTKVLPAGTTRAVHVYTKDLMARMKDDKGQPLWLVRSSLYGFTKAMVVRRVEILGPCTGEDLFGKPLPGTGGRGVAILFTAAAVRVHFDGPAPTVLDMTDPPEVARPAAAPATPAPTPWWDLVA